MLVSIHAARGAGRSLGMDAPPVLAHEIVCDACGYSRRGLGGGALCPECGAVPPEVVDVGLGDRVDVRGLTERLRLTRGSLTWVRTTAAGLALLLYTSYYALRVTLVMSIGPMSLPALNLPGPKVALLPMFQRSLDGRPGPWGVDGTMAALGAVLAVWLLTQPRNPSEAGDSIVGVRRGARWSCVLVVGALVGLLLSNAVLFESPRWGTPWGRDMWFWLVPLAGELLLNTLLYLRLHHLARALGDARAAACFRLTLWTVPSLVGGAILIAGYLLFAPRLLGSEKDLPALSRVAMAAYGALAVAGGAVATAGVASLLASVAGQALGGWAPAARRAIRQMPWAVRQVTGHVRLDPARWMLVAGIALWVWMLPAAIQKSMTLFERDGLGGVLPIVNYPGPKVLAFPISAALAGGGSASVEQVTTDAWLTLAVWLVTAPGIAGAARRGERLRRVARWAPLVLAGAAVGAGLAVRLESYENHLRPSVAIAVCVFTIEAPATVLLYLHLANVATAWASDRLARRLRTLACAAGVLALSPLAAFAMSSSTREYHLSPAVGWACAAYGALAAVAACLAVAAFLRLAWAVATGREPEGTPPRQNILS